LTIQDFVLHSDEHFQSQLFGNTLSVYLIDDAFITPYSNSLEAYSWKLYLFKGVLMNLGLF